MLRRKAAAHATRPPRAHARFLTSARRSLTTLASAVPARTSSISPPTSSSRRPATSSSPTATAPARTTARPLRGGGKFANEWGEERIGPGRGRPSAVLRARRWLLVAGRWPRRDDDASAVDLDDLAGANRPPLTDETGRGIDDDPPRVAERGRRHREAQPLVVRVEQQQEAVVAHRPPVLVALAQRVAVEEDGERLRVLLVPVLVRHLDAVGPEPGDVAGAGALDRLPLEPAAAPEDQMPCLQFDHAAG